MTTEPLFGRGLRKREKRPTQNSITPAEVVDVKKIGRCVVALGEKKKMGGEGAPEIFPVSRARICNAALGKEQEGESPPNSIPFPHAISAPENRPSKLIGGWQCFTIASEEEQNGQLELGRHFWDVYKDLGDPSARKGRQRTKLGEEYGERKGDFDRSEYTSWEVGQTSAKNTVKQLYLADRSRSDPVLEWGAGGVTHPGTNDTKVLSALPAQKCGCLPPHSSSLSNDKGRKVRAV